MIILLATLMLAGSLATSILTDDITHDRDYVAFDSPVPMRMGPEFLNRVLRNQLPHTALRPPFKEGFYYTLPARLLLYHPPLGHSNDAERVIAKGVGNFGNNHIPITMGEYILSPHSRSKRSNSQGRADVLLQNDYQRDPNNANFYGTRTPQTSNYQQSSSASSAKSSGSVLDQAYNQSPLDEVQETQGRLRNSKVLEKPLYSGKQYLPMPPVPHGESTRQLLDHQGISPLQKSGNANKYRLRGSWPQSPGRILDPMGIYGIGLERNLYGEYQALSSSSRPWNTESNKFLSGSSYKQDGVDGSSPESKATMFPNQFKPLSVFKYPQNIITNNSNIRQLDSDLMIPRKPLSYLVGVKILADPLPPTSEGHEPWDLPHFPRNIVEPWASKRIEGSTHSLDRSLRDSSRVREISTHPLGSRLRPHSYPSYTKTRTPWMVLMVPPNSLLRKDYKGKLPGLSLTPNKYGTNHEDVTFAGNQGITSCQKGKVGFARSRLRQSGDAYESENPLTAHPQPPATDGLQPLIFLKQEESTAVEGGRSLLTHSNTRQNFQNRPNLSHEGLENTMMKSGKTLLLKVTDTSSTLDGQELIERTGGGVVALNALENEDTSANDDHPTGKFQSSIEQVVIDGSWTQNRTTGSQILTGMRHADMGSTQSARERLQAEISSHGENGTQETIYHAETEHRTAESKTNLPEGASKVASSASHREERTSSRDQPTINVKEENLDSIYSQNVDEQVEGIESSQALRFPLGSDVKSSADIGMPQQERSDKVYKVVGDGTAQVILGEYVGRGGMAEYRTTHLGRGPEPSTTVMVKDISTSETLQNENSGDLAHENLHKSIIELENESSPQVRHHSYNSSDGSGEQQKERQNTLSTKATLMAGGNSTLQEVSLMDRGSAGVNFQTANFDGERTTSGLIQTLLDIGPQKNLQLSDSYGSRTAEGGAPASSSIRVYHAATGLTAQENLGEVAFESKTTDEKSTAQPITEKGGDTQTIGGSERAHSQTVVTSASEAQVKILAVGQEDYPNSLGNGTVTPPQETAETVKHFEKTTEYSDGSLSTPEIVGHGTSEMGDIREDKISLQKGSAPMMAPYDGSAPMVTYTSDSSGQKVMEAGKGPRSESLVDGGYSESKMIHYVAENEMGTHVKNAERSHSMVAQHPNYLSYSQQVDGLENPVETGTDIIDATPSTAKVIHLKSGEQQVANFSEAKVVLGNEISSTVMHYVAPVSLPTQHIVDVPETSSSLIEGDGLTSHIPHYGTGTINETALILGTTKGNVTGSTDPLQIEQADSWSSTISGESPSYSKIVQYVTSGGSDVDVEKDGKGTLLKSDGARSATKIIRYTTTGGAQKEAGVESGSRESQQIVEGAGVLPILADGRDSASQMLNILGNASSEGLIVRPHSDLMTSTNNYTSIGGSEQVVKQVNYGSRAAIGLDSYSKEDDLVATRYNAASSQQVEGKGNSIGTTSISLDGAPSTSKIIRYWIGNGGGEQGSEASAGLISSSTTNSLRGAPAKSKIIRYIITSSGERREIIGDSRELGHDGFGSMAGSDTNVYAPQIVEGSTTQDTETNPVPAITTKVIRYVTTANGVREGMQSHPSTAIGDDVSLASVETVHGNGQPAALPGGGSNGSEAVHYRNSERIDASDQKLGQPMTIAHVITGKAGAQQVIEQEGTSDSAIAAVDGSPTTYKRIRYVTGGRTQETMDTSNTNQPLKTITRYITVPSSDTATIAQGPPKRISTVTRYVTMPGSGSETVQILSAQDNVLSSKNASPSTVTRYVSYPQQGGAGGVRYIQNTQHRPSIPS